MRSIKLLSSASGRDISGRGYSVIGNDRGLTLIEIMVVMLIITGLAATIGKSVWDSFSNANVKQTRLVFNEISKAVEMYNGDCGGLPTTEQGLAVLLADPGKDICANWGPAPYLKKQATVDAWGRQIFYESDGSTFVLKSLGKDRKDGGTGEAKDLLGTDTDK